MYSARQGRQLDTLPGPFATLLAPRYGRWTSTSPLWSGASTDWPIQVALSRLTFPRVLDGSSHHDGPSVRAPFAVDLMIAEFVGKKPPRVTELSISGNPGFISAYGGYLEAGHLDRIALVNMYLWKHDTHKKQHVRYIDIPLRGDIQSVKVHKLRADHGAGALGYDLGEPEANVTWAGEQWSWAIDKGKGHFLTQKLEENVSVLDNIAQIRMLDSEAAIVWVDRCCDSCR